MIIQIDMDYIISIFKYIPSEPLLFTQIYFWIFLLIVYGVFASIYNKQGLRNSWLLFVSLFFYWKTGGYFVVLLMALAIFDFNIGIRMSETLNRRRRKMLVSLSVFANLTLLAYFKYAYLFIDLINSILGSNLKAVNVIAVIGNSIAGSNFDISTIVLPVGISFFIFRTISYNVDLYRRKIDPITNFTDFGFYVSFFPTLLAGPIVKSTQFLPQVSADFGVSRAEFSRAVFLILNGLIKKMVISDYISMNFVDRVFDNPASFTGFENLAATFGYGVQIYCDFSGYTDIAIGIALLLGYKLPDNFNAPYKAANIAAFWQRWHISLTSWLREYLFLPVVYALSNRLKNDRYFNIKTDLILYIYGTLITMLLCGLWHGADYRFLIWGGIHGLALVVYRVYATVFKPTKKPTQTRRFLRIAGTFIFVNFTWLLFRAKNLGDAQLMIDQMVSHFGWSLIPAIVTSYWIIFSLIAFAMTIHWLPQNDKNRYFDYFTSRPLWVQAAMASVVVFICYQARSSEIQSFIYFQF